MIRFAEEKDIPALLEIYNDEVVNGVATFDLEPKSLEEWTQWFHAHKGSHPLFVWDEDGSIGGYCSLSPYREKEAYYGTVELSLYIHNNYRRRGIGRALMAHIIDYAREHTDLHTIVSVITAGNEASTRLHSALNFTYCGTIRETGRKFGRYLDIENYQLIITR